MGAGSAVAAAPAAAPKKAPAKKAPEGGTKAEAAPALLRGRGRGRPQEAVGRGPGAGEEALAAGVTTFAQIAAWTEADIAEFDEKLSFKGRIEREGWVEQAKKLAEG
jgi:large subunit ribosomal protein L21